MTFTSSKNITLEKSLFEFLFLDTSGMRIVVYFDPFILNFHSKLFLKYDISSFTDHGLTMDCILFWAHQRNNSKHNDISCLDTPYWSPYMCSLRNLRNQIMLDCCLSFCFHEGNTGKHQNNNLVCSATARHSNTYNIYMNNVICDGIKSYAWCVRPLSHKLDYLWYSGTCL